MKQPVSPVEQMAGACLAVVLGIVFAVVLVHGFSGGFRSLHALFGVA